METEEKRVTAIWAENKAKFEEEREKLAELERVVAELESKIMGLTEKIHEGEEIRQGNQ